MISIALLTSMRIASYIKEEISRRLVILGRGSLEAGDMLLCIDVVKIQLKRKGQHVQSLVLQKQALTARSCSSHSFRTFLRSRRHILRSNIVCWMHSRHRRS